MIENIEKLKIDELRSRWTEVWGTDPHSRIGRTMLEKSLGYKIREREGHGLTPEQQERLGQLIRQYKRNPNYFDEGGSVLKPGTRLVKTYQGKRHSVLVTSSGFEYEGQSYGSLSKIANEITGSRWNGWLFFGIKK